MPSNRHIDDVNMADFVDPNMEKPDGDTPLSLPKDEIKRRRLNLPGQIQFYRPEQTPDFNPGTIRKKTCPICNYTNGRLMAVCYHCHTCMACGSYTGDQRDDKCPACGNFNTAEPPEEKVFNLFA